MMDINCDCRGGYGMNRWEIFAMMLSTLAEITALYLSTKKENRECSLVEELYHYKDECKTLRLELRAEKGKVEQIENALYEQGIDISWDDPNVEAEEIVEPNEEEVVI